MFVDNEKETLYNNKSYKFVMTNQSEPFKRAGFTFSHSIPQLDDINYFVFYNDGDISKIHVDENLMLVYKNTLFL